MNFQELLKKQKAASSVDTLVSAAQASAYEKTTDERMWRPSVDKAGNGFCIVRFLPAPDNEIPWAKYFSHGFKGEDTGKWFIENCPTSIGRDCPVCQANGKLWNSGIESDKTIARDRKRRQHYVSNIMVLKDGQNPENEGKVFLYQFGFKLFEKIMNVMQPSFEDETPLNPYNLLSGASLKIKIKQVGGYWNYDASEFEAPSALMDGDEKQLEELFGKLYPIGEFTNEANYKSFAELDMKMKMTLGLVEEPHEAEVAPEPKTETPRVTKSVKAPSDEDTAEEDDDMDYFRKLADEAL